MKKLAIFITFIILSFAAFYYYQQEPAITKTPLPSPQIKENLIREKLDPIIINGTNYYFSYIIIDDLKNLKLFPNFVDQLSTEDLVIKHNCSILVNAGFYSEDFKPLGWLISDQKEISRSIESQLFNGFLSIKDNQLSISSFKKDNSRLGLQSGPLLVQNSLSLPLKIKNDEPRRRVIAAQTQDNQLLFMIITASDSLFSGPLLADTPGVVLAVANKLKKPIIHALNLDGGSASAFYTEKIHLKEFSPIGSFFCLP